MDKAEESISAVVTQCCSEEDESSAEASAEASIRVYEWEEFENSLARLCGLASVLSRARAKKESAAEQLETLIQIKRRELEQVNELERLQRNVEIRREFLEGIQSSFTEHSEQLDDAKGSLVASGNSLLYAAKNLTAAKSRLQEAVKLLRSEGYGRLQLVRTTLATRRRYMTAQIAALYPLLPCTNKKKCPASAHAGEGADCRPLTISGLHVIAPVRKEAVLFTDKREFESSATALGYVAHMLLLLARVLDIRLRYPLRFRASRSFIQDISPPAEASPRGNTSGAVVLPCVQIPVVEFPLFSDGQEPTRAAYAVFLLNKDLEQVLHHLEATSVGPKHILPNLKSILKTVLRPG